MTFIATVQNDSIQLPAGVHLPDGTQVMVEPAERKPSEEKPRKTMAERYAKYIGCVTDAPPDLAENLDQHLYGVSKPAQ
jgi:hypothetical protein